MALTIKKTGSATVWFTLTLLITDHAGKQSLFFTFGNHFIFMALPFQYYLIVKRPIRGVPDLLLGSRIIQAATHTLLEGNIVPESQVLFGRGIVVDITVLEIIFTQSQCLIMVKAGLKKQIMSITQSQGLTLRISASNFSRSYNLSKHDGLE